MDPVLDLREGRMAKKRRNTIPLEEFQKLINEELATDQKRSPEWRQGLSAALHLGLTLANNYGGWEFLEEAGVEYEVADGDLHPIVQDKTRRRFYSLDEVEEEAERLYSRPLQRNGRSPEKTRPAPREDSDGLEVDRIFPGPR